MRARKPAAVLPLGWFAFVVALLVPSFVSAACAPDHVDLRGDWGQARFSVELADTPTKRSTGLMNRDHLATSAGMLFVYQRVQAPVFWMRNTRIPLDMVFVRPDGVVQHVHANAEPLDDAVPDSQAPRYSGGDGILVVLEINGGLAARFGIAPGTEMRHPAFGADAAWPCDPGEG